MTIYSHTRDLETAVGPSIKRPPTLTDTVTDALRESIFRGELQPGEPLREVALAESLAVSRITAREALRRLQEDGLVQVIAHRGAFVARLTPKQAQEIYTFRALVEPYAVRLALEADAYSRQDFERLEALAVRVGELERDQGYLYETLEADIAFHHLACSCSGHRLILETFERLQSLTWFYLLHTEFYPSDAYQRVPSHYDIYEAIRSGDREAAGETLRHHIEAVGEVLLWRMEEVGWQEMNYRPRR